MIAGVARAFQFSNALQIHQWEPWWYTGLLISLRL